MKKILYVFFALLVLLMIAIFSAVNSSYVIDKVAQKYAPDYNITYEHISGNIFTGIQIDKLRYENQIISHEIVYKWNPLTLLQKKITVDEVKIKNVNIDVIKALIASFDVDESDDNSSGSFNFDVQIDNIDISIDPFIEEKIAVNKTIITADDMQYHSDGSIEVDTLYLAIDSNLTQFTFEGSMQERELVVESLKIEALNSKMLENFITVLTADNATETDTNKESTSGEPQNLLLPTSVKVKHFSTSVLPREYMSIDIKKLDIVVDDLDIDLAKIFENKRDMINLNNLVLKLDTNITSIDMKASLKDEEIQFEYLTLRGIDTVALQKVFTNENNESENNKSETVEINVENSKNKPSIWIPKYISIDKLEADFVPTTYAPVEVGNLTVIGKDIGFDIDKLMANKGHIEFKSSTNLSEITFLGNVRENHLEGKLSLHPNKALFELYDLPLRQKAIDSIVIDVNATRKRIVAELNTKAKQILKSKKGEFNIDIDSLNSHLVYDVETSKLKVVSKAIVSTPYAQDVSLSNIFSLDETMQYEGNIIATNISGLESKVMSPLQDLNIDYNGSEKGIQIKLRSKQLKGSFVSNDMKKGRLYLETLETLKLNEFVSLPKELNGTNVNAKIDFPINLEHTGRLKGKVEILSNVINMDADIIYDKNLKIEAKTVIPKNSLLRDFNKEVKWNALTPMNIDVKMKEENIIVGLKTKAIQGNAKYHLQNHNINGKIKLAGLSTTIRGNSDSKMKVNTKITSMNMLEKSIASLYTLEEFPPLEGSATLNASITEMKSVDVTLVSPKLTYKADRKTKHILNDFKATASLEDSKIVLDAYSLTYNKQKFFSTKPSKVNIEDDIVTLESIWLNDTLNVTGKYNMKTRQGIIYAKASNFPIEHEYANIETMIDIESKLDRNNTNIDGKIVLLGGKIKYDINQKSFADDSDIIILQDIKKNNDSTFMTNLSTNINITTKEPLVMKQGPIDIKLKPELGIYKVKDEKIMVLGSVELLKGGTYVFEGKKFVLDKSAIHFTGNPNKPLLEIKVKYRSLNHTITILVSGVPSAPVINFSSNPSLTKEQILSLILFDTEAGGDTHSGDEMMKMMGGAMAKSALSSLGVQLDHLVLGEGNSIEVGKKLTNKITIIYVDGEVSRVKLKYRHGPRTDSVLQMSEESQSYDIIYKNDF